MGTVYNVKVVLAPEKQGLAPQIPALLDAALQDVNDKMSTYKKDSELSRFNQSTETTPFAVSKGTAEVFAMSLQVSQESGGAFDVTVGPLVNAWGFGPPDTGDKAPSEEELTALRARVGYHNLSVDLAANTITKARADIYCDLSAIAKGYAVDKATEALEGLGIKDYMVEVGGEVRVAGLKADGSRWRIAIEMPDPDTRTVERVLELSNIALATSGDYRNFFEKDGVRFSHTIDPSTGRPIAHKLASVSVLHEKCAMADAYATAINVLGPEKGFELAEREGLAVLMMIHDDQGGFAPKATKAFEAQFGG